MCLRRGVGDQLASASLAIAGEVGCSFASGQQRTKGSAGRRVLYHATASAGGKKFLGQAKHSHQPVENVRLQFRAGGTGGPEHALHAESGRKQVSQDGRPGSIRTKEGKEIGRLPMSDSGNDELFDVTQN